jgi:hypothetical protein
MWKAFWHYESSDTQSPAQALTAAFRSRQLMDSALTLRLSVDSRFRPEFFEISKANPKLNGSTVEKI